MTQKLDTDIAKEWQLSVRNGDLQKIDTLLNFLERATALEASQRTSTISTKPREKPHNQAQSYQAAAFKCDFCAKNHHLFMLKNSGSGGAGKA